MKVRLTYLIIFIIAICSSCTDGISYTTSRSAVLGFSEDTVAFDTLITTIGSQTKTLYVYNNNNEALRLTSVRLKKGAQSHFRVNVDGQWLANGQGADFEVLRKDSIVVRVEVTVPVVGATDTISVEDNLLFQLESGVVQDVTLTAGGLDAIFLYGQEVRQDTTWTSEMPFVIYDSLVIREGATLTLEAGTRLLFHDRAGLENHGTLLAYGTIDRPVIFRGDRTDRMFPYLPYDNTPSRWEGIHMYSTSKGNRLINCDIHSGCYGIVCDSTDVEEPTLYMENCVVHNIGGDGLRLTSCRADIVNTQVSNTLGTTVYIYGGAYRFLHCTIAQFYPLSADRGDALYLSNNENDVYCPLHYAHFLNCVITGYADDVMMGNITEGQDYTCDYLFHHSYLTTVASEDTIRFCRVVYDREEEEGSEVKLLYKDKNFRKMDLRNFLYDFTPDTLSAIRNMADTLMMGDYRFDRLGRSRMADGKPDAGCYELEGAP